MHKPWWFLLVVLSLLPGCPVFADSGRYAVQLVTVGPGELYWERFGHNAIVIQDTLGGEAVSYNYGMFDFQQENFMLNFLRGHMLYSMTAFTGAADVPHYLASGRRVTLQELNLTELQVSQLMSFLEWNRQPENADYRYDYFQDNCSTRVRDALDRILDGHLAAQFNAQPSSHDLRFHVNRLTRPELWLFFGTHLGLGQQVDRPIQIWDEFFLPMALSQALDQVTLRSGEPLVISRAVLAPGTIDEPSLPPSWWPGFGLAGLLMAAAILWSRRILIGWWLVTGFTGVLLAGLWLLTDHTAAYLNENIVFFSPLALLAAFRGWRYRSTWMLSLVLAVMALLGLLGKLTPWLIQGNLEIILLTLPGHLAGVWRLHRNPEP
jgi:hypothetical protein